jgi:hypothetical protein
MKFLCDHEKTKENLTRWAAGHEVIVAEYFFWNAGKNDLQKSQEGLLRSLLYQIFRKCPDYIRVIFPGVWRCLEEYVGDSDDVIKLVGILRGLSHVKICVSSRPWNEFEEAFGKNRTHKLYMQDFNHQDINTYVEDEFAKDDNYRDLEDVETLGKALVEDIVTAANGVFLWVVLVVSSLKDGLREADSVARLQKRLRELPTNLEELFERIIFRDVRPSYRDQASHMFLVALEAKENLPLMAYWFLGEDLPKDCLPLRMQQTIKRHKDANKRLIASCKGLLEPRYHSAAKEQESLPAAMLFEYTVDFLHRTVRDYLLLPTTNIRQWAAPDFSPDEAICKALYSQIKTAPHEEEYGSHISVLYETYRYHANAIRRSESGNAQIAEISVLSADLVDIVSKYGISDTTHAPIAEAQPAANVEPNNAGQPKAVVEDTPNADSGPKVWKHRARRLASRLGIGGKASEGPVA